MVTMYECTLVILTEINSFLVIQCFCQKWGKTINNIVYIAYRTDALHVRLSHSLSLSLSLSLSACEEKSKVTASRVPHTRAYGTSNTGALRIHSDELNNSTDRLMESETLMRSEFMKIYLY